MTDQTRYGTDTTTTAWDGFEPAATDSDLHGVTSLFRDPVGAVAYQDGPDANRWVLGDQRNATATAGANGQITDLVNYADFGGAEYESAGWASLVGNDQQPGDPTLGLDHYYARDYDPTTGAWVQPDDWRGLLVRPQSLNRYSYIENTPVSFSDDLGYVISFMRMRDGGSPRGMSAGSRMVRKPFARSQVVQRAAARKQATAYVSGLKAKARVTHSMGRTVNTSAGTRAVAQSKGVISKANITTPRARSGTFTSVVRTRTAGSSDTCPPGTRKWDSPYVSPQCIDDEVYDRYTISGKEFSSFLDDASRVTSWIGAISSTIGAVVGAFGLIPGPQSIPLLVTGRVINIIGSAATLSGVALDCFRGKATCGAGLLTAGMGFAINFGGPPVASEIFSAITGWAWVVVAETSK